MYEGLGFIQKLTIKEAEDMVAKIISCKGDDEAQHTYEDQLNGMFIASMSHGLYDNINEAIAVAKIVASTADIEFARWCA